MSLQLLIMELVYTNEDDQAHTTRPDTNTNLETLNDITHRGGVASFTAHDTTSAPCLYIENSGLLLYQYFKSCLQEL